MTDLCTPEAVSDLLLQDYIDACEQKNPGITARTITAVSGEIADIVSARYPQPWVFIPDLIRYAASVISAYRIVESVTSLVNSEAGVANEWIPLQKQWKYVSDLLSDIAKGKIKLPLENPTEESMQEDLSLSVIAPKPYFNLEGL